jgi:hypothetical protein
VVDGTAAGAGIMVGAGTDTGGAGTMAGAGVTAAGVTAASKTIPLLFYFL